MKNVPYIDIFRKTECRLIDFIDNWYTTIVDMIMQKVFFYNFYLFINWKKKLQKTFDL